jgi:hypothetical protein
MNDRHIDPDRTGSGISRRGFLVATGATGAAVVAFSAAGPAFASSPSVSTRAKPSAANDLGTAAFAASLEVLAVGTYQAALDAATSGKLGPVPPAGATYVQTALSHHQAYLDALNGLLTANGEAAVTMPDPALKSTVDAQFAQVKDFGGAAMLARELEEISSATYLEAIPNLTPDTAVVAGSILAVGQQRVAILNYVLGDYPVPEVFAQTEKAASPS